MPLYRLDPRRSQFTVQAFATGALSFFGHSPTFAVRDFAGVVQTDGEGVDGLVVSLTVKADSLDLLDKVSLADRGEIEGRMRRDVLESAAFPEIAFQTVEYEAEPGNRGQYRAFLGGRLTLHGVTQRHGVDVEIRIDPDVLRLRGGSALRMSAYRLNPVTALGGTIKLKDELKLSFDLVARPEAS